MNALFDDNGSSAGGNSSGSGVEKNSDTTSISAEMFEFIDASNQGIVLSRAVSRTNGCDINADTI